MTSLIAGCPDFHNALDAVGEIDDDIGVGRGDEDFGKLRSLRRRERARLSAEEDVAEGRLRGGEGDVDIEVKVAADECGPLSLRRAPPA